MTFRFAAAAGVLACVIALAIHSLVSDPAPGAVALGGVLALVFLGAGSLAVTVASKDPDASALKLVLATYVAKTTALVALALVIPVPDDFDRSAFGMGVVTTAIAYVVVETAVLVRRLSRPH